MNALIIIDVQNDFLPGGSLAINDGDAIVQKINDLMEKFDLVVATQDWHPKKHCSFASTHDNVKVGDLIDVDGLQQVLWPTHCVQDSPGAEFPQSLKIDKFTHVVKKGTDANVDSYSAFFDNGRKSETDLQKYLESVGAKSLTVVGLATEYCVKLTVLDALKLGFQVSVVLDACRGVNLNEGDVEKAIEEMKEAGAQTI